MAVSLVTVLALVCICYSAAGQPNVLEEGGRGSAIVLLSIELIEESGVFADDNGMLRRIAYVETEDGIADNTYREGFDGGIWAVSESAFQDTQDTNTHPRLPARLQRIRDEFQIDWSLVRWNDLRKPFYSALAARLVLYNAPEAIPPTNHIERQAEFWVQYYHPSGSTADFVATASELKGNVLQTAANEFFIGFTDNTAGDTPTLQLFVTTVEPTPVNFFVETLTGVNLTGTATRNSTVAITLPPSIQIFSSTDRNKGIHVQAEGNKLIVVYGLNYEIFSSDAFLALPCNRLAVDEYEYYAITFDDSTVHPSTVLLVGCEDNTTITTTFGTVLLNKQETYLIEDDGDLTGTRVVANKPISFFSGHYCTFIPSDSGYCDYLTEQVPPTASWGSFFLVASLLGRTSGVIYRIIAAQNSTEVIVSCNNLAQPLIVILNTSGNWHEIQLDTDSFCTIESNSAVLIMQFALGNELDGIGDPFMMMIPPVEQYSNNYVFIVLPADNFSSSYITVAVTPQYYQPDQIFVDSFSLEDANWTTTYCSDGTACGHITRMPMQPGEHQLYHEAANAKLGVTVYGFDRFNSYGYIGGIQLVPAQSSGICNAESMDTVFGSYSWPEMAGGEMFDFLCELGSIHVLRNDSEAIATRSCEEGGMWMDPDFSQCADTFDILEDMNITSDNYKQVISSTLTSVETANASPDDQNEDNVEAVSSALQDTADLVTDQTIVIDVQTVNETVEILDILQEWNATVLAAESANIVESFESIVSSYALQENFTELVVERENLAFVVERVEVRTLMESGRGFSFALVAENGTLNANTGGGAENFAQLAPEEQANAFLPPSMFTLNGNKGNAGIFFSLYQTAVLFPLGVEAQVEGPGGTKRMIGSSVIAATVAGQEELRDLPDPVSILIRLNAAQNITAISCVSYDFNAVGGRGNWTSEGCVTEVIDDGDGVLDDEDIVSCSCNHLTNFAALMDVCSRTGNCEISSEAQLALDMISIIGVVLSLLGIILTIITLLAFKKLRQRDATKYHIQLCIALFCMLLVFVIGIDRTDHSEGCVTVSVLIHYFTLVAVMWMGAEATLMFQKLVIIFVRITTRYIVILSLVCWLVPIIPAVTPAATNWEDVVSFTDSGDIDFCFIGNTAVFLGAFLGPVLAVVAFNFVIFCMVVFVLIHHTTNTSLKKKIDMKIAIRLIISITGVMFLFGLTWVFGALTVAEASIAFQILFALFNSFQGFFIFLFFCVFSKDAREAWKEVLSCGRYTSTTLHPLHVKYTPSNLVLKSKSTTATSTITTKTGTSVLSQSEVPSGCERYAELAALEPGSTSTFGKGSTKKGYKVDGEDDKTVTSILDTPPA